MSWHIHSTGEKKTRTTIHARGDRQEDDPSCPPPSLAPPTRKTDVKPRLMRMRGRLELSVRSDDRDNPQGIDLRTYGVLFFTIHEYVYGVLCKDGVLLRTSYSVIQIIQRV